MKRFWQCPKCGVILVKSELTFLLAERLSHVNLAGTSTCSNCGLSESQSVVFAGTYDFSESDDFIERMIADSGSASLTKHECAGCTKVVL